MTDEKRERVTVLCVGMSRVKERKRPLPLLVILDEDRRTDKGGIWDLKCEPGNVYSVEMNADRTTVYTKSLQWKRAWPDEAERLTMQETARAMSTAAAAERQRARGERESRVIAQYCEPLNRVYRFMNGEQQRAFLANVLHEITRWRSS